MSSQATRSIWITSVSNSNHSANGRVGARDALERAHRLRPQGSGRKSAIFNGCEPVAFVMDFAASSAKAFPTKQTLEFDPTVWLFVVSERVGPSEIAKAVGSETAIIIKKPLHNRLRRILREIAIDVEEQVRPAPRVPASDIRASLESLKEPLTPRQIQIAQMIADGSSNKEIAKALGLSVGTVKVHLHHIFQALKISNRVQLAMHARTSA